MNANKIVFEIKEVLEVSEDDHESITRFIQKVEMRGGGGEEL